MKKVIAIIMAIIMTVSFAACNKQSDSLDQQTGSSEASSENHTDNIDDSEEPSADMIYETVNGSELSSENQNIGSSNTNNNETAGDKNNSAINNSDSPANKPNNGNNSSNIKPNLPNSSNNNTGNNKPTGKPTESINPSKPGKPAESTNPSKPGKPAESTNPSKPGKPTESTNPSKPDETTTPSQHEHNWTSGWFDTEIAKDKNGNMVSLHLCAKCYEYFGSTSGDEWVGRFWDHCDTVHEAGYTTWPLYAYYDAEWCPDCDTMKRGKFAFYGYCDYSVPNKVSTRKLEPWQVKELNLPLK